MDHKSRDRWSLQWMVDQGFLHGLLVGGVGFIWLMIATGGVLGGFLGLPPGFLIGLVVHRVTAATGAKLAGSLYAPSGETTSYVPTYSHIDAMIARGDLDAAAAAFDEEIANSGGSIGVVVKAADFQLRERRDAARALQLFQHARSSGAGSVDTKRYIQQKLVDIHLGPLQDEGRAMAELRRLIDAFPGTREADAARESLAALKRQRGEAGSPG